MIIERQTLTVRDALILVEGEIVTFHVDEQRQNERVSGEAIRLMHMLSDEVLNSLVNCLSINNGMIEIWLED